MPSSVSSASSSIFLASASSSRRMAPAATRYSHSTLSLAGPSAIARGPSTMMSPVSWISFTFVTQPQRMSKRAAPPALRKYFIVTPEPNELPISRVLKPLLLDFRAVRPDAYAGAGINQFKGVQDIIAGARTGAGGHPFELARQEKIRAFELVDAGV